MWQVYWHSLCTWNNPTENWSISGICLRISSVTKCTPLCCGLRLIFLWNHADPMWISLLDEAMLLSRSLRSAALPGSNSFGQSHDIVTIRHMLNIQLCHFHTWFIFLNKLLISILQVNKSVVQSIGLLLAAPHSICNTNPTIPYFSLSAAQRSSAGQWGKLTPHTVRLAPCTAP